LYEIKLQAYHPSFADYVVTSTQTAFFDVVIAFKAADPVYTIKNTPPKLVDFKPEHTVFANSVFRLDVGTP